MLSSKLTRVIVIWLIVHFGSFYAQPDAALCPQGSITSRDPKWPNIPERFEISTEFVSTEESTEFVQTFSSQRDTIAITINGEIFRNYWHFETNEYFTVLSRFVDEQMVSNCARKIIDVNTSTSTLPSTNIIKPSILFGYDARNQPSQNFGTKYINDSFARNIPVNVFEACFYLLDIQSTVSATYYMSDNAKFQGLDTTNQSFPVRIEVRVKQQAATSVATFVYNIFRYESNPSKWHERQALETPAGVYCPNRTNTKPLPTDIPDRFSFNIERLDTANQLAMISSRYLYDKSFQFVRLDVWSENFQTYTELYDYSVGLSYRYESVTHRCMVSDIVASDLGASPVCGSPQFIQMVDGLHLFLMDDIVYQYTGSRRCRDRVLCHVWLGERPLASGTGIEHREWYWAYHFNGQELEKSVPVKFITYEIDSRGKRQNSTEINLYDYRRNPATIIAIDYTLADCYRAMGPTEKFYYGIFTFIIDNKNRYPVQKNIAYLQSTVWETLAINLQIRPIRLAHILVDQNNTDLIVTFTLLDNPPRQGPVQTPLQEPSLDILLDRLRTLVNSNNLMFRARYDETKEVILNAKNGSLNVLVRILPPVVITNNVTIIVNQPVTQIIEVIQSETLVRKSGAKITGLWVGFIVAGLVVGLVGGFLVFRRIAARR